jgi:membrane protein
MRTPVDRVARAIVAAAGQVLGFMRPHPRSAATAQTTPFAPAALAVLDAWQRRHAAVAFPVAVVRKFLDDRASGLATLIAYHGFFSLFPLLLVLVSILGFVLQDDPSLQEDVLDSALARIPVIGAQLRDGIQPLTGSEIALAVGLAGALWAGLAVTVAVGRAFEAIWDVPRLERRGLVRARARGVLILLVLGLALVAATVLTALATEGRIDPAAERLGTVALALAVNAAVFLAAFGLLTPRPRHFAELLPGVALAAAGSLALQAAGGWYVDHAVTRASDTYGIFALVIGLMSWFWLGSHLLLMAGEVNVVLRRRLWPRSLTGELAAADRMALRSTAEAVRQDERQQIAVHFSNGDEPGPS